MKVDTAAAVEGRRVVAALQAELGKVILGKPAVIDDLTHSPQVRELMLEQGRGVVGEAAQHLRSSTAAADDKLESAFRRLVRAPAPDGETTAELTAEPATGSVPPPADATHGG